MATFCIPKQNIDKLKKLFSTLDTKDRMGDLIAKIEKGEGVKLFSQSIPQEEAILLNQAFEKAIASEKASALTNLLRKNLDIKYREKMITKQQQQSIRSFIENRLYPHKKKSEIIPIKDILEMSDTEKAKLIKDTFGSKYTQKLLDDFKKAEGVSKAPISQETKNKLQRNIVDNFLKEKQTSFKRFTIPMKDILKMSEEKRIAFLKDLMPEKDAIKINKEIVSKQASKLEQKLADKLKNFRGIKDFNRFLARNEKYYAGIKEGIEVSDSELNDIMLATANIEKYREKGGIELGKAKAELDDVIENHKLAEKKTFKETILSAIGMHRAVQLGIDFGTTLIQGGGIMTEKAFARSVKQGAKNTLSKAEFNQMKYRILGDDLYDLAEETGLRMSVKSVELFKKEEAVLFNKFNVVSKNPVVQKTVGGVNEILGTFERYVASLSQARFDIFKDMTKQLEKAGVDITTKEGKADVKRVSALVNYISGSSNLGKLEHNAPELNVLLFSARLLTTRLRMLASPLTLSYKGAKILMGKGTAVDKILWKKEFRSLAGILGTSASLIMLAESTDQEVETDPRSSNFGKMKVGNRWIDLTFGYGSYVRAFSQLFTGSKVVDGVVKKLTPLSEKEKETEVRARDYQGNIIGKSDVLFSFFRGKVAAIPSLLWDIFTQETYSGQKPTVKQELKDKMTPLGLSDMKEIFQDKDMSVAWKSLLIPFTSLGISGYTQEDTDWNEKDTKEMKQFREEKGKEKLKEASAEYDKLYKKRKPKILEEIKNMTNKKKDVYLKKQRAKIKNEIFYKYDFIPE